MSNSRRLLLWTLVAVGVANVITLFVLGFEIGDVSRGTIRSGHYYAKHFGNLIEVSETTYCLLFAQLASVFPFGWLAKWAGRELWDNWVN